MEFTDNKAIYLQIAEMICEKILEGHFKEDERIPSVRDMAVQLEVNPNTVMRTFEFLQAKDIITNQRGVGYFVATGGNKTAMTFRKEEFISKELPQLFRTAALLKLDFDELQQMYLANKKKLSKK